MKIVCCLAVYQSIYVSKPMHGLDKTFNDITELGQCLTSPSKHKVLGSIPGNTLMCTFAGTVVWIISKEVGFCFVLFWMADSIEAYSRELLTALREVRAD